MWNKDLIDAGVDCIFANVVLVLSFIVKNVYLKGICLGVDISIIISCIIKMIVMYHNEKRMKKDIEELEKWFNEE